MIPLLIVTGIALIASLVFDRKKTLAGIKKGLLMLLNLLFPLITVLALVSVFLAIVSKELIVQWLGTEAGPLGFIIAALVGSISLIPGFIAFPLGSILIKMGVSISVIAVFMTTLMMVGVFTLPVEAKYFGWKTSIMRNGLSFIGAFLVGILISLVWSVL